MIEIVTSSGNVCADLGVADAGEMLVGRRSRRNIENQRWDDPGENFKITAPIES